MKTLNDVLPRKRLDPLSGYIAFIALILASPSVPQGYCGLEHCPMVRASEKPAAWTAGFAWRMSSFREGGSQPAIQQFASRLEYRPGRRFVFGAEVPVTVPISASERVAGFSNPLLFAETVFPIPGIPGRSTLSLGSQLELPLGDISAGFASDHAMWVPYLSLSRSGEALFLSARIGWSTAVPYRPSGDSAASPYDHPPGLGAAPYARNALSARTGHAAHADHSASSSSPSFVEPHSDRDLLFRLGAGWKAPIASMEVQFSGAHAFEPGFSPRDFFSAGLSMDFPFGKRLSILPEARIPITHPARFESAGGVGIRVNL